MTRALGMRVFATLMVWAVATLMVPSPAAAIKNGQTIKNAPAWAAYVTTVSRFLFTQTSETSCTGTIVADGWVLTAAHCVVAEDANGNPTSTPLPISKFEIVLGRSDLDKTWQGGQWTIDQLQIDPQWDPTRLTGDVALLHLSGPLPSGAVPLPLAPLSFSVPDGASPLAYGYGCTSTSYGQHAISIGDFAHYSCHLSNMLRLTQSRSYRVQRSCTTASDWCLHRAGASEIQNGDSGGPWVPDDTLRSYVVGISSYNSAPQRIGATTVDWQDHHATRITDPTIHNWIDRTAGIQTRTVGAVYRNAGSSASWLFKRDGFLHSIPDGGTYRCLTAAGAPVVSEGVFQLAELPVSSEPAQCTTPPPPHFAWLRRCAIIDEGSGGFHYWVGIYPASDVSCGKAKFVFRRTSQSPDHYVTVTRGHNPWLVWRDGWGCDGHSIWVCLYRFRNPIHGVTQIAYSSECDGGAGCPEHLHISQLWPGSRAWWPRHA
jgi:hypothetical protein